MSKAVEVKKVYTILGQVVTEDIAREVWEELNKIFDSGEITITPWVQPPYIPPYDPNPMPWKNPYTYEIGDFPIGVPTTAAPSTSDPLKDMPYTTSVATLDEDALTTFNIK